MSIMQICEKELFNQFPLVNFGNAHVESVKHMNLVILGHRRYLFVICEVANLVKYSGNVPNR